MVVELLGQSEQPVRDLRLFRPIGQQFVLSSLADFPEPLRSLRAGNQDDVWDVAWSETSADRQMDPLQQAPALPFLLQPFHRHFRMPLVRLPAAAAIADTVLPQHRMLGGERCRWFRFHRST